MNHCLSKVLLNVFVIAFPLVVYAGGSSYSRYGYGDILRYGDSRLYAMGNTGIALIDDGFINGLNPAGLARITTTRFSGGFDYTRYSSKDDGGASLYSTGDFQGLAFAFPISKENGIVLSLESTPYSSISYAINTTYIDVPVDSSVKHQSFYGSGGLSYLALGLSGSPLNTLHIGGRLNYLFGRTRQYQTSSYDNSDLVAVNLDHSVYYSGFTFTLGAIYEGLDELLKAPALHNLTVGISLSTSAALNAEEQSLYSTIDSTFTTNGTSDIPFSLGFGLSYVLKERYRFVSDLVLENWGTAHLYGSGTPPLRNSLCFSVGFETIPAKDADTFWKRTAYRAGFAYHSTYYRINGTGINELLVSGGVGLPMGLDSKINIGLQAGIRGTTDMRLQKDTILRLSVAISASELWFLKFDEEQ